MPTKVLNINKRSLRVDFSWLPKLEKILKKRFNLKKQISIALLSDIEIKAMNKVYRHKDKVTDVLSFPLESDYIIGEVLICLGQARRQAKEKNKTLKSEIQLLTVHGILHILGYDHEISDKEAKRQEQEEQVILDLLNK